jgi:16S rRNA (adenine1518-N6/adenine1519-N6)-dimethyltransferase
VLAIEKDARLVRILAERFKSELDTKDAEGRPKLRLLEDDALRYLQRAALDWSGWKLVANLPYTVASPILVELAQASPGPERLVATLQLEVARRLMAKADDADYGVLTLLVQLDYEPREWFRIPSGCFFPEPDVESACVVLVRRKSALLTFEQRRTFIKLVKRSFSQRRKMMFKLLKSDWPVTRLETALAAESLSPKVRAEVVSLEQFVSLTRSLHE